MNKQQQQIQLRTRKLGLLIYDARNSQRKTLEDTAKATGISTEKLAEFEKGSQSPSLPELEALAYFFDLSLDQFWSAVSLSERVSGENVQQVERLRLLRDRMIGATLKMQRARLNFSLAEVSAAAAIPEDQLKKYEVGEVPVPLPELELLAKTYDTRVEDFFDQKGPIGKWRAQKIAVASFLELPAELQDFVVKPVNKPYLNLALKLSELSVEKLRGIAEGLLEITF
jgi:transcriptional regulator with XRE-family HTH domain